MTRLRGELRKHTAQALEDYKNNAIEFAELQKIQHEAELKIYMPELQRLRDQGNWKAFINLALEAFGILPEVFKQYYAEVPDTLKYRFSIAAYNRYSVPALEPAVIQALQYGRPKLPGEITTAPYIEVYLAAELQIKQVYECLRWNVAQDPAVELFQEYLDGRKGHVYKAKIQPAHIIYYSEHDILQYRSVYDVQPLNGIVKQRKRQERGDDWI